MSKPSARRAPSGVSALNAMSPIVAGAAFLACCGAHRWAEAMTAARPFTHAEDVYAAGDRVWRGLGPDDWREAFAAHPRIGERQTARTAGRSTAWSEEEQATATASDQTPLAEMAKVNHEYEARFGHVYLVCATGRTAAELLADAKQRMRNDAQTELQVAADEQRQITRLRLARLLEEHG